MGPKPSLIRKGTMVVTAKEGSSLLGKGKARPDVDAATRGQSKQIKALMSEKPKKTKATPKKAKAAKPSPKKKTPKKVVAKKTTPKKVATKKTAPKKSPKAKASPKKPKLNKSGTMIGTAAEGKSLLGGEKLGDTRQVTKAKKAAKPVLKKAGTMDRTIAESAWTTGTTKVNVDAPIKTRKRKSSSGRAGSSAKKAKPAAKPKAAKPNAAKSKVSKAKAGKAAKGKK